MKEWKRLLDKTTPVLFNNILLDPMTTDYLLLTTNYIHFHYTGTNSNLSKIDIFYFRHHTTLLG